MNTREALKRLYDCAECHSADFYPHMADMEAHKTVEDAIDKIDEINRIEKELGVGLAILFKALKDGIWSKGGFYGACYLDAEPSYVPPRQLEIGRDWYDQYDKDDDTYQNYIEEENALCLYSHDYDEKVYSVRIKDYGKTWALTKEELKA